MEERLIAVKMERWFPCPPLHSSLILPAAPYSAAVNSDGKVVLLAPLHPESGYSIQTPAGVYANVGVVGEIDSSWGRTILRPDSVSAVIYSVAFFLVEDVQTQGGILYASGKKVEVVRESEEGLDEIQKSVNEAKRRAMFIKVRAAYEILKQARSVLTQIAANVTKAQVDAPVEELLPTNSATLEARLDEAISAQDFMSAAACFFSVPMFYGQWLVDLLLDYLYPLVQKGVVTEWEYINAATDFVLGAAGALISLGKSATQEDILQHQIHALMKLRDYIDAFLKELGGVPPSPVAKDVERIKKELKTRQFPPEVKSYLEREIARLEQPYAAHWAETDVILKHVNFLVSLPWDKRVDDVPSFEEVANYLDNRLYGLRKAKEHVLDYLAVLMEQSEKRGDILCFVGPPGTGKTDMARAIAEALNRPFRKISLGGVNDEAEIRGHRRTYVGALPGRVMKAIAEAGVKNPVILLDEIDKIQQGVRGDPAAALMEVLDPEFNREFYDHFVDFPFDLSEVLFICAANEISNIPHPLLDRLNVVEFRPYTQKEKIEIAKHHMLPKVAKETGIKIAYGYGCEDCAFAITPEAVQYIISVYTLESGVRELYRLMRKLAARNLRYKFPVITPEKVDKLLWDVTPAVWKYKRPQSFSVGEVPVLRILMPDGEGFLDTMIFKVVGEVRDGLDVVETTCVVGETSMIGLKAAVFWARHAYKELTGEEKPPLRWLVHVTNPSIQMAGTSLGISAAIGALSALLNKPVNPDVAFTGEIDIRGNVHAVGGIATKIATAEICGYKKIYLPEENRFDLRALDFTPNIQIVTVKTLDEIVRGGIFVG